jgi:type IV secretion system protein VirB9
MTRSIAAITCALAILAGVSSVARAESIPNPGPADPRMRWVVYNPDQVYKITGVYRASTVIVFASDEKIFNGGGGDTVAWEVSPVQNILFLKPREPLPPTNLTVLTQRPDGTIRLYQFELSAREGSIGVNDPNTVFQVRFRYPDDEAAAKRQDAAAAAAIRAERREETLVSDRLVTGSRAGAWNWAYAAVGDARLEPAEISDNGRITVLRFPGNQPLPSIYAVDDDGNESLVQPIARGPQVTIDTVHKRLRLRRNAQVLCITNFAFDPRGANTNTGTLSPDVRRVPVQPKPGASR